MTDAFFTVTLLMFLHIDKYIGLWRGSQTPFEHKIP